MHSDLITPARKSYSGPLEAGEDLMTVEIGETIAVRRTNRCVSGILSEVASRRRSEAESNPGIGVCFTVRPSGYADVRVRDFPRSLTSALVDEHRGIFGTDRRNSAGRNRTAAVKP